MLNDIKNLLENNSYCGRGIIAGLSGDGKKAVIAYFTMGRSENSRNRVFEKTSDGFKTKAFDESKLTDPSLVIYNCMRKTDDKIIVTNGDQTDTIFDFIKYGKSFEDALRTRCFEPDAPNFTPRISAELDFSCAFSYKMSILKSMDSEGSLCGRYFFEYEPIAGRGHFIHTYACDGNPIPSFEGEPELICVPDDIDAFTETLWTSLNADNKVSLYVSYISLQDKTFSERVKNKLEN